MLRDGKIKDRYRKFMLLSLACILGFLSWLGPILVIPGNEKHRLPMFPEVLTDKGQVFIYMVICLSISGLILGFIDHKRGALWGFATMLPISILAALEGALGFASHNLLGIEIIVYAIYTIPAIVGGLVGAYISRLISRKRVTASKET